jgi:hypothetical protein
MPASTIAAQFRQIEKWGELAAIKSIENSIAAGWRGLFEPQGCSSAGKSGKPKHAGFTEMQFTGDEF